jgi:hypothetical protein
VYGSEPLLKHVRLLVHSMKRREMNSLAHSLCAYLCSRNNDIAGYWGVGILCAVSKRERKSKLSFQIYPGTLLRIHNYEISNSKIVTDKLVKFGLDSIEGRLSFFENGRYSEGVEKFICSIAVAITQGGRTGMSVSQVECWPHNSSRERQRAISADTSCNRINENTAQLCKASIPPGA